MGAALRRRTRLLRGGTWSEARHGVVWAWLNYVIYSRVRTFFWIGARATFILVPIPLITVPTAPLAPVLVQEHIKDVVSRTVYRHSGAAPSSKPPENTEHKKTRLPFSDFEVL